jgi:hypothetical protein
MFLSLDPNSKALRMFTKVKFVAVNPDADAPDTENKIELTGMVWARWSEPRHWQGKTSYVIMYDIRTADGRSYPRIEHKSCTVIEEPPKTNFEHIPDTACARVSFTNAKGEAFFDVPGTKRGTLQQSVRVPTIKPWIKPEQAPTAA